MENCEDTKVWSTNKLTVRWDIYVMYELTSQSYFRSMIRRMDKYVDIRIEVTKITHYVRMIGIPK